MPAKKRDEEREEELIGYFEYRDGSTYEGRFQARGENSISSNSPYPAPSGHKRSSNAAQHAPAPKNAGGVSSSSPGSAAGAAGGLVDPNTQPVTHHGSGRYCDASGANYDGQWIDGRISGVGTFHYTSGASYTGSMLENHYHGMGKYVWPDGSYYDGHWENNVMHGMGTYVDSRGRRWYGKFFNGKGFNLQPELSSDENLYFYIRSSCYDTSAFIFSTDVSVSIVSALYIQHTTIRNKTTKATDLNALLGSVLPPVEGEGEEIRNTPGGEEESRRARRAKKKERKEKKKEKREKKSHRKRHRDDSAEETSDKDDSDEFEEEDHRPRSRFVQDAADSTSGDEEEDDEESEDGWDDGPLLRYEPPEHRHLFNAGEEGKTDEELGREYEERLKMMRQREKAAALLHRKGPEGPVHNSSRRYTSQMLPQPSDPKVFAVKCKPRMARILVARILNKCYNYRIGKNLPKKVDLGILSVFSLDHVKEYIYLEAHRQRFVINALEGLVGVFRSNITQVQPDELMQMMEHRPSNEKVQVGMLVRLRQRPYRGDLGQVTSVLPDGSHITVKVIPREDFIGKTYTRVKTQLPQNFFVPSLAVDAEDRGDHIRWGDLKFDRDGYLLRTVTIRSVIHGSQMTPAPTPEELARFYNNNREEVKVAISRYTEEGTKALGRIGIGETVRVFTGMLKDTIGTVTNIVASTGTAMLSCKVPNRQTPVALRVELRHCVKNLPEGTHVVVTEGQHAGMGGTVVRNFGDVVTLFCDRYDIVPEITVKANECSESKLAGTITQAPQRHSAGSRWNLYDLVALTDTRAVGCVVLVQPDGMDVLTEDNERRRVGYAQVKPITRASKKALDIYQNVLERGAEVTIRDTELTPFHLGGESGRVEQVCNDTVFARCRRLRKNAGLVALPAQCVLLTGGRKTTKTTPTTTRTLPAPQRRPHNAVVAEYPPELRSDTWHQSSEYRPTRKEMVGLFGAAAMGDREHSDKQLNGVTVSSSMRVTRMVKEGKVNIETPLSSAPTLHTDGKEPEFLQTSNCILHVSADEWGAGAMFEWTRNTSLIQHTNRPARVNRKVAPLFQRKRENGDTESSRTAKPLVLYFTCTLLQYNTKQTIKSSPLHSPTPLEKRDEKAQGDSRQVLPPLKVPSTHIRIQPSRMIRALRRSTPALVVPLQGSMHLPAPGFDTSRVPRWFEVGVSRAIQRGWRLEEGSRTAFCTSKRWWSQSPHLGAAKQPGAGETKMKKGESNPSSAEEDYGMSRAFEEPTLRFLFEGDAMDFKQEVREALLSVLPPRPRNFVAAGRGQGADHPPPPPGSSGCARDGASLRGAAETTRLLLRSLLHRGLASYAMARSTPGRLLTLYEVVATAHPALASVLAQHFTAAGLLSSHGSPSLLQRYPHWLDQADSGNILGTIATRELVTDDGPPLNTEARYDFHDKCFVLRGTGKFAVVGGSLADYAIVSATLTTNKKDHNGLHLFVVPLRNEKGDTANSSSAALGARRSDILLEPILGEGETTSASGTAVLYFNHTRIPADHLLGPYSMDEATGKVVLRADAKNCGSTRPSAGRAGTTNDQPDMEETLETGVDVLRFRSRLATAAIALGILKKQIRDAVQITTQQHVVGPSGRRDYPYLGLQEVQSPLVGILVKACLYGMAWNQFVRRWCTLESRDASPAGFRGATLFFSFLRKKEHHTRTMELAGLLHGMQEVVQVELENYRRRFTHLHASLESAGAAAGSTTLQLRQESKNIQDLIREVARLSVAHNIGTAHWGWRASSIARRFPSLQRFLQNPLYSPRMADLGRHYLVFSHKHYGLKKRLQRSMKIEWRRGGAEHAWHDWRTFRHRDLEHCGEAFMEMHLLDVAMKEVQTCAGDLRARKLLRDMGWIYALTRQAERLDYYLFTRQMSRNKAVILLPHLDNISTVFAPQSRNVAEALCGRWYDPKREDALSRSGAAVSRAAAAASLSDGPCGTEAYWTIPGAMTRPERGDGLTPVMEAEEEEETREGQERMREDPDDFDLLHADGVLKTNKQKNNTNKSEQGKAERAHGPIQKKKKRGYCDTASLPEALLASLQISSSLLTNAKQNPVSAVLKQFTGQSKSRSSFCLFLSFPPVPFINTYVSSDLEIQKRFFKKGLFYFCLFLSLTPITIRTHHIHEVREPSIAVLFRLDKLWACHLAYITNIRHLYISTDTDEGLTEVFFSRFDPPFPVGSTPLAREANQLQLSRRNIQGTNLYPVRHSYQLDKSALMDAKREEILREILEERRQRGVDNEIHGTRMPQTIHPAPRRDGLSRSSPNTQLARAASGNSSPDSTPKTEESVSTTTTTIRGRTVEQGTSPPRVPMAHAYELVPPREAAYPERPSRKYRKPHHVGKELQADAEEEDWERDDLDSDAGRLEESRVGHVFALCSPSLWSTSSNTSGGGTREEEMRWRAAGTTTETIPTTSSISSSSFSGRPLHSFAAGLREERGGWGMPLQYKPLHPPSSTSTTTSSRHTAGVEGGGWRRTVYGPGSMDASPLPRRVGGVVLVDGGSRGHRRVSYPLPPSATRMEAGAMAGCALFAEPLATPSPSVRAVEGWWGRDVVGGLGKEATRMSGWRPNSHSWDHAGLSADAAATAYGSEDREERAGAMRWGPLRYAAPRDCRGSTPDIAVKWWGPTYRKDSPNGGPIRRIRFKAKTRKEEPAASAGDLWGTSVSAWRRANGGIGDARRAALPGKRREADEDQTPRVPPLQDYYEGRVEGSPQLPAAVDPEADGDSVWHPDRDLGCHRPPPPPLPTPSSAEGSHHTEDGEEGDPAQLALVEGIVRRVLRELSKDQGATGSTPQPPVADTHLEKEERGDAENETIVAADTTEVAAGAETVLGGVPECQWGTPSLAGVYSAFSSPRVSVVPAEGQAEKISGAHLRTASLEDLGRRHKAASVAVNDPLEGAGPPPTAVSPNESTAAGVPQKTAYRDTQLSLSLLHRPCSRGGGMPHSSPHGRRQHWSASHRGQIIDSRSPLPTRSVSSSRRQHHTVLRRSAASVIYQAPAEDGEDRDRNEGVEMTSGGDVRPRAASPTPPPSDAVAAAPVSRITAPIPVPAAALEAHNKEQHRCDLVADGGAAAAGKMGPPGSSRQGESDGEQPPCTRRRHHRSKSARRRWQSKRVKKGESGPNALVPAALLHANTTFDLPTSIRVLMRGDFFYFLKHDFYDRNLFSLSQAFSYDRPCRAEPRFLWLDTRSYLLVWTNSASAATVNATESGGGTRSLFGPRSTLFRGHMKLERIYQISCRSFTVSSDASSSSGHDTGKRHGSKGHRGGGLRGRSVGELDGVTYYYVISIQSATEVLELATSSQTKADAWYDALHNVCEFTNVCWMEIRRINSTWHSNISFAETEAYGPVGKRNSTILSFPRKEAKKKNELYTIDLFIEFKFETAFSLRKFLYQSYTKVEG
eukprot:gene1919-1162_t